MINALHLQEWSQTAVFIQYDDSDGWYDHVTGPIVNASATGNISGQNDTDTNANDSLIPVLPLSTSVTMSLTQGTLKCD